MSLEQIKKILKKTETIHYELLFDNHFITRDEKETIELPTNLTKAQIVRRIQNSLKMRNYVGLNEVWRNNKRIWDFYNNFKQGRRK